MQINKVVHRDKAKIAEETKKIEEAHTTTVIHLILTPEEARVLQMLTGVVAGNPEHPARVITDEIYNGLWKAGIYYSIGESVFRGPLYLWER